MSVSGRRQHGTSRATARLISLIASITAAAVLITSVVTWVMVSGAEAAVAGTVQKLEPAKDGAAWVSVDPRQILKKQTLSPGKATPVSADSILGDEDADSWLIQITAEGGEEAAKITFAEPGIADAPAFWAPAGQSVSTTQLIRLHSDSVFEINSSAEASVAIEAIAYFTRPKLDGDKPSPGGSIAVTPRTLLHSDSGVGGSLTDDGRVTLSPRGLGDVPSSGVAAVWLSIEIDGQDASVQAMNEAASSVTIATAGSSPTTALTLAMLDDKGLVSLKVEGDYAFVRATMVGWVASQSTHLDAVGISGGLVPLPADTYKVALENDILSLEHSPLVPAETSALYSVRLQAPESGVLGATVDNSGKRAAVAALGDAPTAVSVAGSTTAVMVAGQDANVPPGSFVESVTLLGYFPHDVKRGGKVSLTIDTPQYDAVANLAQAQGTFRIEGRVPEIGAGIRSLTLATGGKFIGSADLSVRGDTQHWSLDTSAPPGTHTVLARATDYAGAVADAEVTFRVQAPATSETIVAPNVVVLEDQTSATIAAVTKDTVTFEGDTTVGVGDILSNAATAETPEGLLRRVIAVERLGERAVVHTVQARMTEAVLQTRFAEEDAPLVEVLPRGTSDVGAEPAGAGLGQSSAMGDAGAIQPVVNQRLTQKEAPATVTQPLFGFEVESKHALETKGSIDSNKKVTGKVSVTRSLKASVIDANGTKHSASVEGSAKSAGDNAAKPTEPPAEPDGSVKRDTSAGLTVAGEVTYTQLLQTSVTLRIIIDVSFQWGEPPVRLTLFEQSLEQKNTKTMEMVAYGEFSASTKKTAKSSETVADLLKSSNGDKCLLGRMLAYVGIPLTLSFYVSPEVFFELKVKAEVSERIKDEVTTRIGFRFERGTFTPINESKQTKEAPKPSTAFEVTLTVGAGLEIEAKVYEVVGIFVGADYAIKLKGSTKDGASIELVLSHKLTAKIGARLSILSVTLLEHVLTFTLFDEKIWGPITLGQREDGATDLPPDEQGGPTPGGAIGSGSRALVIVLDISGSMSGDRLDEAKATLNQVITEQPIGAELGIWTYPGDNSCDAGQFQVPVAPITGTGQLIDTIESLSASGNTPTGEALQAVTADLKSSGHGGATILLVSDGESNCQVQPCEVVQEILDDGFELTVETVGFQMSGQGLDELECISSTTGGQTHEVDDAEALWQIIEEQSKAQLDVALEFANEVTEGRTQPLTVTVRNPSARDAEDVNIAISTDRGQVRPSVSPSPNLRLGNIPAGGSVTRLLQLRAEAPGVGEVSISALAWAENVNVVATDASYAIRSDNGEPADAGPVLIGEDASSTDRALVMFGDGLAAGVGAGQSVTGAVESACGRSDEGLFADRDNWSQRLNLACDGATSRNVVDTEQQIAGRGIAPQLSQLRSDVVPAASLVTVGAADIGLPSLLAECTVDAECALDSPVVQNALIAAQQLNLAETYASVWQATNTTELIKQRNGDTAAVIVAGYPLLFPQDRGIACSDARGVEQVAAVNSVTSFLNASIEASVERAVALGYEVYYSPALVEAFQPADTVCSASSSVQLGPDDGAPVISPDGYGYLSDDLAVWSQSRDRLDARKPTVLAGADGLTGPTGVLGGLFAPEVSISLASPGQPSPAVIIAKPGQGVSVDAPGFAPGTPVTVALMAETVTTLGTAIVGKDGRVKLDSRIPVSIGTGGASIVALGVSSVTGESVQSEASIQLAATPPWWVVLGSFVAFLLLICAGILVVLAVKRRKRY